MTPSSLPLFDKPTTAAHYQPRSLPVAETVALYGPESLSDAQIVEATLNRVRPGRAEEILHQVENMGRLTALGPAELQALGLTRSEMARFAVLQEMQRRSTRSYLLPKAQSWTEERFGMLAMRPGMRACMPLGALGECGVEAG